jgi:hypothetical protein
MALRPIKPPLPRPRVSQLQGRQARQPWRRRRRMKRRAAARARRRGRRSGARPWRGAATPWRRRRCVAAQDQRRGLRASRFQAHLPCLLLLHITSHRHPSLQHCRRPPARPSAFVHDDEGSAQERSRCPWPRRPTPSPLPPCPPPSLPPGREALLDDLNTPAAVAALAAPLKAINDLLSTKAGRKNANR